MQILALSDRIVPYLHGPNIVQRFGDVDLIVGCGDLPAYYLEYIVTQLNVPLVYVPGNHDPDQFHVPGGVNIDGRLINLNDCFILGLGGSRRYKKEGRHQYSEFEMRSRIIRLVPRLLYNRIRHRRAVDVLVTHAPPRGIHDANDQAHVGFTAFLELIHIFRPALMLHGHTHQLRNIEVTETEYKGCLITNVFPYRSVNFECSLRARALIDRA